LQLQLIYIIQLLLQLQLTVTYFSVILLFQLQLQLTEGTLRGSLEDATNSVVKLITTASDPKDEGQRRLEKGGLLLPPELLRNGSTPKEKAI